MRFGVQLWGLVSLGFFPLGFDSALVWILVWGRGWFGLVSVWVWADFGLGLVSFGFWSRFWV